MARQMQLIFTKVRSFFKNFGRVLKIYPEAGYIMAENATDYQNCIA